MRKDVVGNLTTIYIGGGTPTILTEKQIEELFKTISSNYEINTNAEITIEANPRTITAEKTEKLLKLGINRISIGVQSFVDKELIILGRVHNAEDAIDIVKDVRSAGFKNISIDLIYGIPFPKFQILDFKSQIQNWQYSLQKALELSPEHISIYELTPEKDTPLYEDIKNGRLAMLEEGVISEMYYAGIDILKDHGYVHYEISNFAKPNFECRHNLNYWNRGEYLGIGAGSHSFFNGKRTAIVRNISRYIESIDKNKMPVMEEHYVTDEEALKEFIFLGMRKTDGIDMKVLPEQKSTLINKAVEDLASHGLIAIDNNQLKLTRKGLILSNEVIVKLML